MEGDNLNLLICNDMANLIFLKKNIKLDKFKITSSEESAKILCNKNNFEILIYDKSLNDIAFFKKRISLIYSLNEIKSKINNVSKNIESNTNHSVNYKKKTIKPKTAKPPKEVPTKQAKNIPINTQKPITTSSTTSLKDTINSIENIDNMFKTVIVQSYLNKNKAKDTVSSNLPSIVVKNKIFTFTSCKGGIGQTSLISYIANNYKFKKLILDLNFSDGGSDLSYMLGLPKIPHIGTYIKDDVNTLKNHLIPFKNNTFVLQAPPLLKLVENFSTEHLLSIFSSFNGSILIDLPKETTLFKNFVLDQSSFIYILTTSHLGELSRIQNSFSKYKNKSLVLSNTNKNDEILRNINLDYKILKNFQKDGGKFVCKDILNHCN